MTTAPDDLPALPQADGSATIVTGHEVVDGVIRAEVCKEVDAWSLPMMQEYARSARAPLLAENARLEQEVERLKAQLEVASAASAAAIQTAQWQSSTNAELNALAGERLHALERAEKAERDELRARLEGLET